MRPAIFAALFCVLIRPLFAGDAIAIGYNSDGAWRDLWVRASDYLWKAEILGQSDKTGYVAVARGRALTRNKDVTAVGRGKSQDEADQNALKKLNDREATTEATIVYQYFSYGSDSGARSDTKHKAKRASKQAAGSRSAARKA